MSKFKAGDKVKISTGGWGIHPTFEGMIVTIKEVSSFGAYSLVEDLVCDLVGVTQKSGEFANEQSFELYVPEPTTELIREVNRAIYKNKQDLEELLMKREALLDQLIGELQ